MPSDTANITNFVPPGLAAGLRESSLFRRPSSTPNPQPGPGTPDAGAETTAKSAAPLSALEVRASQIYEEQLSHVRRDADRGFFFLMGFQWVFGVVVALCVSPLAWSGAMASVHIHVLSALFLGGIIVALPMGLAYIRPGEPVTRMVMGVGQMLFGALLIHLTGGRIETHFHVFGSLAFLAFYRDWRVLVVAAVLVGLDHTVRGLWWPMSVFGVGESLLPGGVAFTSVGRVLEHAGWVVFETFFLVMAVNQSLKELHTSAENQAEREALSDAELRRAQQQAETILGQVDEGLFLLDSEYRIGAKHSGALNQIFLRKTLVGASLMDLLRGGISERTFLNTEQFLKLMFDPRKKERQILRVNPLEKVEISISNEEGAFETRNLDFRFSRVLNSAGDAVEQLLVVVTDVTDRVKLEQQLEEVEKTKDRQLGMLLNILHVEPAMLREFIGAAETGLGEMNDTLKSATDPQNLGDAQRQSQLRGKLEIIGRVLHQLKGNAALLALEFFVQRTHNMEDITMELRRQPHLNGTDFLKLVMKQSELEQALLETRELLERMAGMRHALPMEAVAQSTGAGEGAAKEPPLSPGAEVEPLAGSLVSTVAEYVTNTARRLKKIAELDAREFDEAAIPAKYHAVLLDVLAHFANNSLAHGLEDPARREAKGKPQAGRLVLRTVDSGDPETFQFSFSDDGQGLQASKLRGRAIALGFGTPEEVSAWPGHKLVELIFEPGFSTAEGVSRESGRGFGMNVVKDRIVRELGGEIRVSSVPGNGCTFHIVLPV